MHKRSRFFTALGIALLLAAALLALWNIRQSARANAASASAAAALTESIGAALPPDTGETVIPDYVLDPAMPMPSREADGLSCIGLLELPSLDLSLPVQSEWSYPALKLAPCRYSGSAYQNDLVIAAHNYRSHFGPLARASVGDAVRFTDADGNVFRYKIAELETLSPTAIEEMTVSDWELTLFTCTLGGSARLAVRCALVEAIPAAAR